MRRLITVADDFGLSISVNDAVIEAATNGILTSASLMVSGPAAVDAVAQAHANPGLAVGLHLVLIEGNPTLPTEQISKLVDATGRFPSDQFRLAIRSFFNPFVRRQLAAEIRAQFEAFRATGLKLDHANAHKHMHLHPTIGRMMIDIGRDFGLRALRVPEQAARPFGRPPTIGERALRVWCALLRRQARRAGLFTNDRVVGLTDTGHMTAQRTRALLGELPDGVTEMYFHPATYRDMILQRLMPDYEHEAELQALLSVRVPPDAELTRYGDLAGN